MTGLVVINHRTHNLQSFALFHTTQAGSTFVCTGYVKERLCQRESLAISTTSVLRFENIIEK